MGAWPWGRSQGRRSSHPVPSPMELGNAVSVSSSERDQSSFLPPFLCSFLPSSLLFFLPVSLSLFLFVHLVAQCGLCVYRVSTRAQHVGPSSCHLAALCTSLQKALKLGTVICEMRLKVIVSGEEQAENTRFGSQKSWVQILALTWEATGDGSCTWVPTTHMGHPHGVLGPGHCGH